MQEYVQKSMSTTLPRKLSALKGGEFSQAIAPARDGIGPSAGKPPAAPFGAIIIIAPPGCDPESAPAPGADAGRIFASSACSIELVPFNDSCVRMPVSQPRPI